ncbi:MAG: methylenetetrahydrofolate reductase [NAD(P)H] [Planctomycetaceae bacterium]|nr:methylenetetrahydrofolate reductase [NAD(P)H] [Planctomycetaceae bacterium]
MKLSEAYADGRFGLSFELFPPKTPAGEKALFEHLNRLIEFGPSYITCTYGAGGSTQAKTLDIIDRVQSAYACMVASHLTCVGLSRNELIHYLQEADKRNISNIVALRGDPPQGADAFEPPEDGLRYASELVTLIRDAFPEFGIAVAGYPETHREAKSPEADLENLQRKVELGGDLVITQLFYDNADFFRFQELCKVRGIQVPIVPGILPVTNLAQIQRISGLCGATLPPAFEAALKQCEDDVEKQFEVGVRFAIEQVTELIDHGVPGIHFYVLNKSNATARILKAVKVPGQI